MVLHHRRLLSPNDNCELFCKEEEKSCSSNCQDCIKNCQDCIKNCLELSSSLSQTKHKTSTYLIIGFSIVAAVFFAMCCYAIYVKFISPWNRRRRRRRTTTLALQQTEESFTDEEHGPVVDQDHHIWFIRTTGLQQSIISAITVCEYKKGEGLVEGTDCSVCLSEFEEGENLRLLPKCNHAFHLICIDTWLRSHTNCPMCRAPIVANPAMVSSMEVDILGENSVESGVHGGENSGGGGGERLRNVGNEEEEEEGGGDGRRRRSRVCESGRLGSEVVNVLPRRSVSLDSASAAKINLALTNVLSVQSCGNSKRVSGNGNSSSSRRSNLQQSAPCSMKRSRSYNGKHLLSWYSRSQKKPNAPPRSF